MKDLVEGSEVDPGFAGPEEYKICRHLFKEKDTKLQKQNEYNLWKGPSN